MEKIVNNTCEIVISTSYKEFDIYKLLNKTYDKVAIITDENVKQTQLDRFKRSLLSNNKFVKNNLSTIVIKPGEGSKSIKIYEELMNVLIEKNLSRKSVIIALGGGVVGDLAGFIASTYMRGIDVIQVPTTLLSQVDSSIGGKTGINLGNYKNIIGSFHQPKLTYINTQALQTLPDNEFKSAISEVIKYGVIYDYDFLRYLSVNSEDIMSRKESNIYEVVKKCVTIKIDVVDKDEKENELRKILNFGHTFGHGIEKLLSISHGDSVGIGMKIAFNLALIEGLIDEGYYSEFIEIVKRYSMIDYIPKNNIDKIENKIIEIMKKDKKNSFDKINLILPVNRGTVIEINNISEEKIFNIIKESTNA